MCPTSARPSVADFGASLAGVLTTGAAVAGCAGCDGFKVGRLSSGLAFHILAPMSFYCWLKCCVLLLAQAFCPASLLQIYFFASYCGSAPGSNRILTGGKQLLSFPAL